jgi:hypothetical protein
MSAVRARGRPSKLNNRVADRLVALVSAGSTLADAAHELGVAPRTITGWRARAWSRRPQDSTCVQLERRLVVALAVRERPSADFDWNVVAERLAADYPQRWGLHDAGGVQEDAT